jgi:hypothetical protein
MFRIVSGNPTLVWCPVDYSSGGDTLYVGQLVKSTGDGVAPLGQASGAYDTSAKANVFGVVVGTNNINPTFNTTYKADYITSVSSQAALAARSFFGPEGGWGKAEPMAMVQVALIDPSTIIQGSLFGTTYGVAPTIVDETTGDATGLTVTYTAGTADATTVADNATLYGVTGANAGVYRICTSANNSASTCAIAFPQDIAIGDTFKIIGVRPCGLTKIQTDSESTFIDVDQALTTNYWGVTVVGIDLSVAGKETINFRFNTAHFNARG